MKKLFCILTFLLFLVFSSTAQPPVAHPSIGEEITTEDGKVKMRLIGKRQNYGGGADTRDAFINSPKSVNIHPDGKKYYVNSLEGGTTVIFDAATHKRLGVIRHTFDASTDRLWSEPSDLYPFTHYKPNNRFMGKPVESTFSHGGRYLWVPYYRRSYDINAQDPSAVAVIDTKGDSIVKMMECGPLPKMVATSPDGRYVAIAHWGNNTVALIDISSSDPADWHHSDLFTVDYRLPLNFPLDRSVDRDNGSGYALRGTVFTPGGRYLLVGCMGGGGGIAVIDMSTRRYLGRVLGMMSNVRHLLIKGPYLYLSINGAGYVQRIEWKKLADAATNMKGKQTVLTGWANCKVGAGARTITISPSGRYVFAACNTVSRIFIVDTEKMKTIGSIAADSYPVGMDISDDGRFLFTTSQGRKNQGGNAVDIYEITYAQTEPKGLSATPPPFSQPETSPNERPEIAQEENDEKPFYQTPAVLYAGTGVGIAALALGGWKLFNKQKRR